MSHRAVILAAAAAVIGASACSSRERPTPAPAGRAPAASDPAPAAADEAHAEAMTAVSPDNVGRTIVLKGWAADRKGGAVLVLDDGTQVWLTGVTSWPEGFYRGGDRGKRVRVTGTLDEDHGLPVFEDDLAPGDPIPQGVPVPAGTDLEAASRRYVLRDAKW